MTNEQIEQLMQFITEQLAITSQALAKLSLDSIARSADIDKNTADIARLADVVEKNSADIEKLKNRLDLVIRLAELQAKLQDGNQEQFKQFQEQLKQFQEQLKQLAERQAQTDTQINALARLIEQSFKRSRNGDSN